MDLNMGAEADPWAEWLLRRRFGGNEDLRREFIARLTSIRDRVLDNAGVEGGEIVLDVGCGDGLIAFGALERGASRVIFDDISEELLETCRSTAAELDVLDRCRFINAPAEDLAPIDDASVDVVTTRAVLMYLEDKQRAVHEFFRVLRPGGRMSLFEPINRLRTPMPYDVGPVEALAARVWAVFEEIQPPDRDPMLIFDERDLLDCAERGGFREVCLHLEVESKPPEPRPWETFLHMVGNPKIPSYAEAMEQALTPEERDRLTAHLRRLVEEGHGRMRMVSAFLWATKG